MDIVYSASGFPEFFDKAPVLRTRDLLAEFLGAVEVGGVIEYHYLDAVKLAGHSCPTVAGAYLMVLHGLKALYGEELPERGGVEVLMADSRDAGTTGVIGSVATLLTGAATDMGFGGIGPMRSFSRRDLMSFDNNINGVLALRRKDTGLAVQIELNAGLVPFSDEMKEVMPKAVSGQATAAELKRFADLWQERVCKMLVDHADDPRLVVILPL